MRLTQDDWREIDDILTRYGVAQRAAAVSEVAAHFLRKGFERAAMECDREAANVQAMIDLGKGTWPADDYVPDDRWARWHGQRSAALGLGTKLRMMAEEG